MARHGNSNPPSSLLQRAERLREKHPRTDAGHPLATALPASSSSSHQRPPPPPPPARKGPHQGSSSRTAPAPPQQLTSGSLGHSLSPTRRRTPPPIPIRKPFQFGSTSSPPYHSPTRPAAPPKRRPPPVPPRRPHDSHDPHIVEPTLAFRKQL
ncbi:hypothetical protein CPB85DRAFT_130112 [Mucidula mucida]|nr:hypothetical protein CPB85DRAFT_130112 [Mucidula mucida]